MSGPVAAGSAMEYSLANLRRPGPESGLLSKAHKLDEAA